MESPSECDIEPPGFISHGVSVYPSQECPIHRTVMYEYLSEVPSLLDHPNYLFQMSLPNFIFLLVLLISILINIIDYFSRKFQQA